MRIQTGAYLNPATLEGIRENINAEEPENANQIDWRFHARRPGCWSGRNHGHRKHTQNREGRSVPLRRSDCAFTGIVTYRGCLSTISNGSRQRFVGPNTGKESEILE